MTPAPATEDLPIPGFHVRPIRPEDAEAWFTIVSDPAVYGPTSWPLVTVADLRANIGALASRRDRWRWAIVRTAGGELVGTCGATRWDVPAGVAEVAYELTPGCWGMGLASAAVGAFLNVAEKKGFHRVEAHTWEANAGSARVLSRCGFQREEWLPSFRDCRGEPRNFWRWGRAVTR